MATAYDALFQQEGDAYGVSPALLSAVAREESNYNPQAVSPAGAEGLMQLEPGTAASLGVSDPFNPAQAIAGAAKLLGQLLGRYGGNVSDALAAYNAGPGAVDAAGGVPNIPETQKYVRDIEGMLSTTASAVTNVAGQLIATAAKYLGVPYAYGGTTPAGFDCSGFVQYVMAAVGISVPRTSEDQATIGQPITGAQAAPGDLVFFSDNGSDWSHVGIYLGAGQMIDAPHTGATVRTENVAGFAPYTQYRRVIPGNSASTNGMSVQLAAEMFPGGNWDPLNWFGSAASSVASPVVGAIENSVKDIVNWGIKGVFVLGGVGLVVLGLAMSARTPAEHLAAAQAPAAGAQGGAPVPAEIPPVA